MVVQDNPVFSVVVVIVSDTMNRADATHLEPCLESLLRQTGVPPIEIVVPPVSYTHLDVYKRQLFNSRPSRSF